MSMAARKPGTTRTVRPRRNDGPAPCRRSRNRTGRAVSGRPGALGIVVLSGDYARVHYALMMASAAAAIDRRVAFFVTMDAVPLLCGGEGWRSLRGSARDDELKKAGVADVETLLEACGAMDVAFMVCDAGLKAQAADAASMRDDLEIEVTGLVGFYRTVGAGQIVSL